MAEAGQGWHSLSHRMAGGPMQQAWVSDPRPAELDSAWAGPSWQPHHCGSQIPNWSTALMAALQGLGGGMWEPCHLESSLMSVSPQPLWSWGIGCPVSLILIAPTVLPEAYGPGLQPSL